MSIEHKFDNMVKQWIEHCGQPSVRVSSAPAMVIDCDAYKELVTAGPKILPLIRKLYDERLENNYENFSLDIIKGHGLAVLVREIVGSDFKIPDEMNGYISRIENYTKNWLDENMVKYVK